MRKTSGTDLKPMSRYQRYLKFSARIAASLDVQTFKAANNLMFGVSTRYSGVVDYALKQTTNSMYDCVFQFIIFRISSQITFSY